jgi:drug/metabolite transporter (DMT)-like permease
MNAEPHPRRFEGIVLVAITYAIFPLSDVAAKFLTESWHVVQISWARYLCQVAVLAPFVLLRHPVAIMRSKRPGLQFWRGFFGFASNIPFVIALSFIPLADAFAVGLMGPLMVTALSVPLLGEQVGWRRWAAVGVAFLGAMIIVRPGLGIMHWATALPLAASLAFSLYQIFTRKLAAHDHPEATLLWGAIWGFVMGLIIVPFVWTTPTWHDLLLVLVLGVCSVVCHFMLVRALNFAPVSLLAPFSYSQMLSAIAVSYIFWNHFPDSYTLAGAAVITASGLYAAYRERVRARTA